MPDHPFSEGIQPDVQAWSHWPSWPPEHSAGCVQLLWGAPPGPSLLGSFPQLFPRPVLLCGVGGSQMQHLGLLNIFVIISTFQRELLIKLKIMEDQFSKEKKWNSSHLLLILLVKLKSKNRLCDSCSFMRELSLFCSSLGAEEADDHLPEALPNRPIEMRGVQRFVRLWVTKHASHCHLLDSESTEEMEQLVLYTDRNWGWALARKHKADFSLASFEQAPFG